MANAEAVTHRTQFRSASSTGKLPLTSAFGFAIAAAASFHLSFEIPAINCLILFYAFCLVSLSYLGKARTAFRIGFVAGMLVFAPQLAWFWNIFGLASFCLWAVLSVFTGLFAFALTYFRLRHGDKLLWLAAPVLWTAFEYFRSELYFLRFSWSSAGYVFSGHSGALPVGWLGVYGCGFMIFLFAGFAVRLGSAKRDLFLCGSMLLIAGITRFVSESPHPPRGTELRVAGIQLEFPPELSVPMHLDKALTQNPTAQLFVLSEYSFDGPIPRRVREWCRRNGKYLVAGGKADAEETGQFYNTAFVVDPNGEIVFSQAKSVPIQFFKDGLPALEQKLWDSPWGKIALCVCYDMSYRAEMDRFMRQGAQALIVPFMDVKDWGRHQHQMHAKITPLRAQEYQIPIFRVGSSGISQIVNRNGNIRGSTSFPGQEEMIAGSLVLSSKARLPADHLLAPACTLATGSMLLYWAVSLGRNCRKRLLQPAAETEPGPVAI